MFNMNETGARSLTLKDCQSEKITWVEPAAKFDLILYAPEVDGAIELTLVYNADLFSAARMAFNLEQLSAILEQAVAAPEQSIESYSLMTPLSRSVLPDPTAPLNARWEGAVHELISRQAQTDPERQAVIDASDSWSYRELDEQSSRLANYFIQRGIRQHEVVAIYAQRSASLAVALLGALKAGAVFVVLDPAYPAARLLDYLGIAGPTAWLQLEPAGELPAELANFLDAGELPCRWSLPRTKSEITNLLRSYSMTAPDIFVGADDPAYIAFTSGSTGQPKGVLCRHGPMSHFLPWQEQEFNLASSDRYCLLSGLGYNHLQREIFTALAAAAALHIPTPAQVKAPEELTAWLRERKITILHLTPALGRLLATAAPLPTASLRRIFFGGDLLTRQDIAAMRALAPNAKIVSFYGATETQRAVGYYDLAAEKKIDDGQTLPMVPTGRGAPDVQLLLLTASGQLAGVGELGELHVRSPHLATGYVDDGELTAANFVANPFTGDERDRLYRTGEFGRYRPDGNVEWAGRRDRRVSVRGFRVELAEVESALSHHPAVRAVAVVGEEEKSATRLIAYIVADLAAENLPARLREFLAGRLPHYMVAAEFVMLERMPLNPNGKVDYDNLPRPIRRGAPSTAFEPIGSAVEARLAAIFAEVLGIERIGRWDDFFQLGGHSLLAVQAAARIREILAVGLDLRTFLESPTVAALAKKLAGAAARAANRKMRNPEREEIEI
jgi:amino acid adenylation domain-containing protein